jgi:hypothetical protein
MAFLEILKTIKNQLIIELRHAFRELATDLLITKFKKERQTERMVETEGGEWGKTGSGNKPERDFWSNNLAEQLKIKKGGLKC